MLHFLWQIVSSGDHCLYRNIRGPKIYQKENKQMQHSLKSATVKDYSRPYLFNDLLIQNNYHFHFDKIFSK
jgi:hypothetical protein